MSSKVGATSQPTPPDIIPIGVFVRVSGGRAMLPWVQALRAVAAMAVAFSHVANDAMTNGLDAKGTIAAIVATMPWNAGVDIFFVISGFIIVHASAPLFSKPGGMWRFLERRLTRIVPLYWAMTTLFLAMTLLQPAAVRGQMGGLGYLVASYLFVPWARPDGLVQPPLGLGWTLNHEMFFYLVLTPFLLLPRRSAVPAASATLCIFVAFGQAVGFGALPLDVWASPIILEFVIGMGLALAAAAGFTLPGWLRLTLVFVALGLLHVDGEPVARWRAVSSGLPVALLVLAAISARSAPNAGRLMRGLVRLGDASYALYLVHPFVMRAFAVAWRHLGPHAAASGALYVVLSLMVAQLCALAINTGFERRVATVLRRGLSHRP